MTLSSTPDSGSEPRWLAFPTPGRPIVLLAEAPVIEILAKVLPGWTGQETEAISDPDVRVRRLEDRYVIEAKVFPDPVIPNQALHSKDLLGAAVALANALTAGYVAQAPELIQVHAASAIFASGLVVFPGQSHGGKSTLAVHLAERNHRLFGDDRLGLSLADKEEVVGVALGVAPKLRLPLPADCVPEVLAFVEQRTVAKRQGVTFLSLPTAASLAETEVVSALVLLNRTAPKGTRAELREATASEMVRAMLTCCYAPNLASPALLTRAKDLAGRLPCYILSYWQSHEAAALVSERFGGP